MTDWVTVAVVVAAVVLLGLYLSMTAGRLDRLHHRIDTSRLALETQLLRRSSVCVELSSGQWLDPASSLVLASSAHQARTSADLGDAVHSAAESDLTISLVAALAPEDIEEIASIPEGPELLAELGAACRRVQLSRRFHNDAVRACRQLRAQRMVRWFRLAGRTPLPEFWEMDDSMPEGLAGR